MKQKILFLILITTSFLSYSQEQEALTDPVLAMCPAGFTETTCRQWLDASTSYLQNKFDKNAGDADAFKKLKRNGEFTDALLASPFVTSKLDKLPVDITLKVIDIEDADSVLALDFSYDKELSRTYYDTSGSRMKSYKFDFSISGTVTQSDEENPRNFIDASVSFSLQNMPSFNEAKALAALNKNHYSVYNCTAEASIDDIVCATLINDETIKPFENVGASYYLDYGFDLGYETDQAFDASNTRLSGYLMATYEDMSRNSFMGVSGIVPSLRVSIDSVRPSAETPRAMAGDDSSYERLSAEFHLSVPLTRLLDLPYLFSFNYRTYDELAASDIVKNAKLDSYRLRTYSLSAPVGLILSYSSGRLPFGLEEEQTIELGFKTYF
jgi:hypothetical protein